MPGKRVVWVALIAVVLILIIYTVLVTPRRFVQCLPAPVQYLTRAYGKAQQAVMPAISAANSVRLLVNGNESLPAMLEVIDGARVSIRWQVMLFQPDEAGQELAAALARAARRGVNVQLSFNIDQTVNGTIDDNFSDEMKADNQRRMEPLLRSLREAGVEVRANPAGIDFPLDGVEAGALAIQVDIQRSACVSANHYDHRKLLIVDGRQAWIGGMNVGRRYLFKTAPDLAADMTTQASQRKQAGLPEAWEKWLDAAVVMEGPVVGQIVEAFNWKWEVLGGQALPPDPPAHPPGAAGSVSVQLLQQRPGSPQVGARFFQLVNEAQREIWVASPFVSYQPALEALQAASRRGVRVIFIYPNAKLANDTSGKVFQGSVNGLVQSGVELSFNDLQMAHTKLLVVDGQKVLIGSLNLNHRSFRHDLEIAALVEDETFARQVIERVFQPYLQISYRVRNPVRVPWNPIHWIIQPFT